MSRRSKRNFGLTPTPYDSRDFTLGAVTSLPPLDTLPTWYIVEPYFIADQKDSDFCSAYMSCSMSEPQEGVQLEPSWSFAKSKELSGDVNEWGQNIRTALKTHIEYGAILKDFSPYNNNIKPTSFLRDIKNWPDLLTNAYKQRKKSYFKVTGQYDNFDNARAAMYKFGNVIGTGVLWGWKMNNIYLRTIPTTGTGHAVSIIGFTKMDDGQDVLILKNSYGTNVGLGGLFYVTRDVYNHFSNIYGHYMFMDISKEEARECYEKGIKLDDHWLVKFIKRFL